MAEIVIDNLRKDYGDFTAVEASSFKVCDGEFFMLLGPSGCGKTTTMRMIAGLEMPTSGKIYIDGEDVSGKPAADRDIAFVFQMFALYPHLNVRNNIIYPLKSEGMPRAQINKKLAEVSKILGIEDILKRPVGGLSGGDRQRVALGRAIVRDPKAFLMDEPLGALDVEFRERMAEELRALHDRMNATTIYVTHDQLEAMQMGDKIVVMNHGVIEQFGAPQIIYDKPATMFVANFIGSPSMNFLRFAGKVSPNDTSVLLGEHTVDVPRQLAAHEGGLVLGIRPEHIILSDDGAYRAEVLASEYLGTNQIITLNTAHGQIKARIRADKTVTTGANVGLKFNSAQITLFEEQSEKAILSELNEGVLEDG
ncbi:MAG TPA: ABC transporter ATP-binding protein [Desulfobacterales bacterium]|nr:ABC transporter ATP-binding protein [Desulfobacterales bacterium]HIP38588.1 ABC transporter ATP-binding protein [Desulfocapsa sulfexigens]